jgi:hypothetical protein
MCHSNVCDNSVTFWTKTAWNMLEDKFRFQISLDLYPKIDAVAYRDLSCYLFLQDCFHRIQTMTGIVLANVGINTDNSKNNTQGKVSLLIGTPQIGVLQCAGDEITMQNISGISMGLVFLAK